jgi:hypothetical protein
MKKLLLVILLSISLCVLFLSCKDNSNTSNSYSNSDNELIEDNNKEDNEDDDYNKEEQDRQEDEQTQNVYICTGGFAYAYHSDENCEGLNNCSEDIIEITEEDAQDKGYIPCHYCYGQ